MIFRILVSLSFVVAIHGYAVMSNHFHLVVATNPNAPAQWSDEQVATRWLALSSMVHVDLNPIRAGMAQTPETSAHTSVRARNTCRRTR